MTILRKLILYMRLILILGIWMMLRQKLKPILLSINRKQQNKFEL